MSGEQFRIETASLPWTTRGLPAIEFKELADRIELVRLGAGATLAAEESDGVLELFVLEGELHGSGRVLEAGGYAVRRESSLGPAGDSGCTLFSRRTHDPQGAIELVECRSGESPWLPGQGGLRVKPLGHGAALVHWPAGERFLPHKHWGGEEIFVLSGTFRDEHGVYPAGTWLQSPHLSAHHPFVEEETVIWVKTGHLHPDAISE